MTLLSACACAGDAEFVRCALLLPSILADTAGLNEALFEAALHGREEVARLLLDAGADVNTRAGGDGDTPLHAAARGGHAGVAALLLDRGADPNAPSDTGFTPLHESLDAEVSRGEDLERLGYRGPWPMAVTALLIARGADVNAVVDASDPETPLDWAAQAGHRAAAKLLRRAGGRRLGRRPEPDPP